MLKTEIIDKDDAQISEALFEKICAASSFECKFLRRTVHCHLGAEFELNVTGPSPVRTECEHLGRKIDHLVYKSLISKLAPADAYAFIYKYTKMNRPGFAGGSNS